VRNFLEFSRPPALKRQVQPIGPLIEKTLALFSPQVNRNRICLTSEVSPDLPPVLVDAEQVKQVLINLLDNAAEAVGDSGRVCLAAGAEREFDDRPMVVIRVSDSGRGMSEEVQRRIFEPFFSTKDNGTGLGLCISAQIMARHDGRLVLESSGERGTVFAVWIPAAAEVTVAARSREREGAVDGEKENR
jgi:two-component system, NtrC family, sensor kinase